MTAKEIAFVHRTHKGGDTRPTAMLNVDKVEVIPSAGVPRIGTLPLSQVMNRGRRITWRTAKASFICI